MTVGGLGDMQSTGDLLNNTVSSAPSNIATYMYTCTFM